VWLRERYQTTNKKYFCDVLAISVKEGSVFSESSEICFLFIVPHPAQTSSVRFAQVLSDDVFVKIQ
jgi:hypothetical protein